MTISWNSQAIQDVEWICFFIRTDLEKCSITCSMHRSNTVNKLNQSKTVLNKYVSGFWCKRTVWYGLERKYYYVLWTYILARSNSLKLKCFNDWFVSYKHSFSLHKTLMDWSHVDYHVLSAVWNLLLMAPMHCRGSTGESKCRNEKLIIL